MKHPRGHFSPPDLWDLIKVLFLALGVPILSIAGLVALSILKFWCTFSWCWLAIPAGVLVVWALYFQPWKF